MVYRKGKGEAAMNGAGSWDQASHTLVGKGKGWGKFTFRLISGLQSFGERIKDRLESLPGGRRMPSS